MQIDKRIYVVGSGWAGYNLTDHYDCDIYLVDCGEKLVMIDAGAGIATEQVEKLICFHGFSMKDIDFILLTHTHGDHVGGAKKLKSLTGAELLAHPDSTRYLKNKAQDKMSIDIAVKQGLYPPGFQVEPCEAYPFKDGETIQVGEVSFTAIDTPGHCSGHNSYLVATPEKKYLFTGDSIFLGGKISLQNIWDCNVEAYARTARRLNEQEFDALLPSHFGIDLSEGKLHTRKAVEIFDKLGVPGQASDGRS
ncbi:MAG: MBL fold metallo-hydrolase [Lachnospiraceae bacterium]|jgi:hydroxyacylglutathione hydrolase|nr:MBL fold metallo-hydrolase [Lachnospiraceae bacterium]